VSTIASFSLQIFVGISKVCAEHDNWNSSSDQLPQLPLDLCSVLLRDFTSLFATVSDPAQAKVFGCGGGKN